MLLLSVPSGRRYVGMEKKNFFPTKLGIDVNRFLVSNFDDIFNVGFTADGTKWMKWKKKQVIWH